MNFNGILIGSEDPKRLTDYYRKLFGEPMYDDGGYTTWQMGSGSISVGPHSEVHGKSAAPGRIIWNIVSDDVKGDFDRFQAAGAIVVREPTASMRRPGHGSPPSPTPTTTTSS